MSVYLETEYVPVNCGGRNGGCNVQFAMTRSFYNEKQSTGEGWYCPNGHSRIFTADTTEEALRKSQARNTALRDQLEAATREAEKVRAALLRDRHRFANGVCPCCNRSFENVRRHMTTKHPDYDVTKVEQATPPRFPCTCRRTFATLGALHRHQTMSRGAKWYEPTASAYSAHLTKV